MIYFIVSRHSIDKNKIMHAARAKLLYQLSRSYLALKITKTFGFWSLLCYHFLKLIQNYYCCFCLNDLSLIKKGS